MITYTEHEKLSYDQTQASDQRVIEKLIEVVCLHTMYERRRPGALIEYFKEIYPELIATLEKLPSEAWAHVRTQ